MRRPGTIVALIAVVCATALAPVATASEPIAIASDKACGSFRIPGLLTPVRVRVTKEPVACKDAYRIMKKLFNRGPGSDPENWNCIGPQTGYARCSKSNPRRVIVATF
jgi:hypothetical protein